MAGGGRASSFRQRGCTMQALRHKFETQLQLLEQVAFLSSSRHRRRGGFDQEPSGDCARSGAALGAKGRRRRDVECNVDGD